MLCSRVQLPSQRGRPEVDGVGFRKGNTLTYFCFYGGCADTCSFLKKPLVFSIINPAVLCVVRVTSVCL